MNKKGSVLMIALWILAILVIFALGLGYRASINLRLVRYQRDRLKAFCLAHAAIKCAIEELEKDVNSYDSLGEPWSNNEEKFRNIRLDLESGEFAAISYTVSKYGRQDTIFGMIDECGKININTASEALLASLLKRCDACQFKEGDPERIAKLILFWRGDLVPEEGLGGYFKMAPFASTEELVPLLEFFYQDSEDYRKKSQDAYLSIKNIITTYGYAENKININTASEDALIVLAISASGGSPESQQFAYSLVNQIAAFRDSQEGPFKDEIIINDFSGRKLSQPDEITIFNNMKPYFVVKSDYFRIESTGNAKGVIKEISAVYNRQNNKMIYWHES